MITHLLGTQGIVAVVGILVFIYVYRYSIELFDFIERHTLGTRSYILERLEFLFIQVNPDHITYLLLFLSFGLGIIVLGLFVIFGNIFAGVVFSLLISFVGWKIPRPFISFLVKRRINSYQNQMVDGLTLLGNGLRAGMSVPQGIGMVVDELPAPISQEFNILLQQNKIGVPLEECFENLAKRIPTEDNQMFVTSVNILRETGGNLPEVFDTIVIVIRERIRLQQKIDTFVAQGTFQGATIFMMPFFLLIMYYVNDPEQTSKLFTNPIGLIMLLAALILDVIGAIIILKIVRIKI